MICGSDQNQFRLSPTIKNSEEQNENCIDGKTIKKAKTNFMKIKTNF